MLLSGKTAIITGAGTGLGMGTSEVFAAEGANVVMVGRRAHKLEEVASGIRAKGGVALTVPADVAAPEAARNIVARATAEFGGVDILVNNAVRHPSWNYTHRLPIEHLDEAYAVNLRAPFMLIQEALPSMLQRGGGSIINVSSILGVRGMKYASAYCATKAGMVNLTRAVALEYAEHGIRANVVCPGGIRPVDERHYTDEERFFMASSRGKAVSLHGPSPEEAKAVPHDPLSSTGIPPSTPWEMAQTLLYLAGPHSTHVNGAVINADRGSSAG